MSSFYSDSGRPVQSKMDEVAILFTVGVCTIGLASYLYLRAISVITSLRFELNTCVGSLNELNENMNSLYIRAENFVSREELDEQLSLTDAIKEEGKYQAWQGTLETEQANITIYVIHETEATHASNEAWTTNEETDDASTTVRDYYVDTFNSDYDWQIRNNTAYLSERMVSTWTSLVRVTISMTFKDNTVRASEEYTKHMMDTRANVDSENYTWRRMLVLA